MLIQVSSDNLIWVLTLWVLSSAVLFILGRKVLKIMRDKKSLGYPEKLTQGLKGKQAIWQYAFYFLLAPLFFYFMSSYILKAPEPIFHKICTGMFGALILTNLLIILMNLKSWLNLTKLAHIKFTSLQDSYQVMKHECLMGALAFVFFFLISFEVFFLGGSLGAIVLYFKYAKLKKSAS